MGDVTPLGIYYIDPDGNTWDLNDMSMTNGYACAGIAGIEGLPTALQVIPMLDGTAYANLVLPQPGAIALAIGVGYPASDSQDDYYGILDRLTRAFFNRRNGLPAPGYIQVQRPDGSTRQIPVYCTSGMNTPDVGLFSCLYSFTLQTPDPYWSDLAANNLVYSLNNATGILPVLPVAITGGTILGDAVITNQGNSQAWPIWNITGPGTPTIKNLTTGRQWALNTSIPAGQVVQVTTKPGTQYAVNLTTSTNVWDQLVLSTLRDLWSLMAGDNRINITMAGSTVNTSISVTWTNRWLRA